MNNLKKYHVFGISVILSFALSSIVTILWKKDWGRPKTSTSSHHVQSATTPEIIMNNLSLHQVSKKEENGWLLNSRKSSFIKPLNVVECETVTCTLLTKQAEVATFKATKSIINRGNQTMFLAGPVQGTFKGMQVVGNDVNYTFSSHQLESTKTALFSHPSFNITAAKSSIDLKNKKVVLDDGVSSEFSQPHSLAK